MTNGSGPGPLLLGSVLALGLVLIGCAATPGNGEGRAEVEESVADILSQPLDAEEYGTPRRCISSMGYRNFQVISDRYVLFEGAGRRLWLNELRGRCPGLRRATALAFDMRGNQICDLDRFKPADWFDRPRFRRWPWDWMDNVPCTLGRFQPVTEEQVEALRAAVQQR